MKKVLVVVGHTDIANDSVANKTILEEIRDKMPNAEIDVLSELYPDFKIDTKAEQEKLVNADIIVFQFPMFWHKIPSLLACWMENTFLHGFSHGTTGNALAGKKVIYSFTSGAPVDKFTMDIKGYTIEQLMVPLKADLKECKMEYVGYVHTGGVSYNLRSNPDNIEVIRTKAKDHAKKLLEMIENA